MRMLLTLLLIAASAVSAAEPVKAKKVVLIAGPLDGGHPAGTHEYEKTVRLFKHCLDTAGNVKNVRTEAHLKGWPDAPETLNDADTIVVVSSGSDRNPKDHPLLVGDRLATLKKHMDRGCGLVLVHWSTFMPNDTAALDWVGGHFDYQSGPAKNGWYSKISTVTATATPGEHPACRGIKPFEIKDEFYHNLRFRATEPKATPILTVNIGKEEQTVGYALERAGGGRGVGFTGGHFFDNWRNDNYRKLLLNAILWTAHADVPADGVKSDFPGDREMNLVTVGSPALALILTGHDGPFHNWRETSQVLKAVIERDGRFRCRIVDDVEFLAREDLSAYDLIVQNYVNWERPGLTDAAKKNLLKYLDAGKGFAVIHFADGAFHASLPKAKESDWPEYRKIVRRVWDHGPGKSGHDPYGKFAVTVTGKHPITAGMSNFETTDELYYKQQGDEPVEVLATAKSKDTGKDEPLAWVYQYGKARVFQTVLGHSAESIRGDGPATLIRRGCTWAANRSLPPVQAPAPAVTRQLRFEAGKFDKALDARVFPASIEGDDRYRKPPITVECWTKLFNKGSFNVLVSSDPKSSARHWEIYTYAGSGVFSAYLPGMAPSEVKSSVDICDGAWHHVAMSFDGSTVRLWVDAKKVVEQKVLPMKALANADGPLLIGGAYAADHRIGCDGLIDDVRVSNVIRDFKAVPNAPLDRDTATVSLWKLDGNEGISADTNWTPPANLAGEAWERETDKEWVDGRFQKTDTGPFQNATVDYAGPAGKGRVFKATAIKLGDKQEASFLFDRNQLRFAATWTGGFLNHSARRFGLLNTPTPAGPVTFGTSSNLAGWADAKGNFATSHPATAPLPREWAKFSQLSLNGQRTSLTYSVGKTRVTESPWAEPMAKGTAVVRTIRVDPHADELKCLLAEFPGARLVNVPAGIAVVGLDGQTAKVITVRGPAALGVDAKGVVSATFPSAATSAGVEVIYWVGPAAEQGEFLRTAAARPAVAIETEQPLKDVQAPRRWTAEVTTQLKFGKNPDGPLEIDTFELPYQNQYNALFFVSGVDFVNDKMIAICTAHGDVWLASGNFTKPGPIKWTRYATGLYQPLGLKIVDGVIHVLERGQLTALTGDGEADTYRCVNNDWHAGGGEHSYDTCLETDPAGNFYFFKTGDDHTPTGGCLMKVSKDGKTSEIYSTGFRHPIGLGVSPTGVVSGADQEGNWMPVTRLDLYKKGGFYGDMRTNHRTDPPKTFDPPLLWIPKEADNSAGGQVWVPEGKWGPLGGTMLHLSYGRCKGYAILRDGTKFQAAAADLGIKFLSGSARGRFHPTDGHLYVVGLDGWQTAAEKDGSLQRVRYTGQPFAMPVGYATEANKITLKFDREIDPESLTGDKGFVVERWNYRWSAAYGSKDWSLIDPNREARDVVSIREKKLSADRKTVTLTVTDLAPCMQMRIGYKLAGVGGNVIEGKLYTTVQEKP